MTPDEKAKINDFLKQMGGTHTVDELEAIRKRSIHTLEEWAAQDSAAREAMPQDVRDMKMVSRYAFFLGISGMMPLISTICTMEMAIEAAYNLGKAAPKS